MASIMWAAWEGNTVQEKANLRLRRGVNLTSRIIAKGNRFDGVEAIY